MQNTNVGNSSGRSDDDSRQRSPALKQNYPAAGHYMKTKPKPVKIKTSRWLQALILVIGIIVSFFISFLSFTAYKSAVNEERPKLTNNLSADENDMIDDQYPEIDQKIKDLANRIGLTKEAKKIFYQYKPEIFESSDNAGFICNKDVKISWRITISGCWSANTERIYLINDKKLETTATHEFLHAVYYDLYIRKEHEKINEYLNETYNQNVDELKQFVDTYDDLSKDDNNEFRELNRYNELHSLIGSQVEEIPVKLEDYYSRYFKDRQVVISFYEQNK